MLLLEMTLLKHILTRIHQQTTERRTFSAKKNPTNYLTRLLHLAVDPLVVNLPELVPLRAQDDGVGALRRGVGAFVNRDQVALAPGVLKLKEDLEERYFSQ